MSAELNQVLCREDVSALMEMFTEFDGLVPLVVL